MAVTLLATVSENNYCFQHILNSERLELKEISVVLLNCNLNIANDLINCTRMRVKYMHNNSIDCEVLTGASRREGVESEISLFRTVFPVYATTHNFH